MTMTGWSLKVVLALAVAALIWARATSIAVRSLESRLRSGTPDRAPAARLLAAR